MIVLSRRGHETKCGRVDNSRFRLVTHLIRLGVIQGRDEQGA